MEPKINCSHCQQQIWVTWLSRSIRCPYCGEISLIQRSEHSGKEQGKISGMKKASVNLGNNIMSGSGSSYFSLLKTKMSSTASPNGSLLNDRSSHTNSEERPRKRALLCGVTYKKRKYKLKGTIHDATNMKDLLIDVYGFPKECVRILTEDETDPSRTPTRKNIQESLQWLVDGCQSGDSLVFFFSGHGLRQPDFDEDERDGFDETICPVDFTKEGMILDNDINSIIVRPLPKGVTLHAIVDACHSGTILDLPLLYNYEDNKWDDNSPPSGVFKGTSGGLAISLSACGDHEMAADTSAFSGRMMSGAMTSSLIRALKKDPKLTYGQLLTQMHETIKEANEANCFNSRFLMRVFRSTLRQEPQLSSSEEFDINEKEFKL